MDNTAILKEVVQWRVRFRELSFGLLGVKVLMVDPSGDIQ